MKLDERLHARAPRPEVVHALHPGVGEDDVADTVAVLVGELAVHQHVERAPGDPPGAEQQIAGDGEAEQRIGAMPAEPRRQAERNDHARVDQHVGLVVQRVRAHGDRIGPAHDVALERDQGDRENDGEHHHGDADVRVIHRPGGHHAARGLEQDEYRRAGDEGRLTEAGKRLCLAVSEPVLGVGRLQGVVHGDEVDQGRHHVHHRIDQRRKNADRAGEHPGRRLDGNENARHRDRRPGGLPHQPARLFARDGRPRRAGGRPVGPKPAAQRRDHPAHPMAPYG